MLLQKSSIITNFKVSERLAEWLANIKVNGKLNFKFHFFHGKYTFLFRFIGFLAKTLLAAGIRRNSC